MLLFLGFFQASTKKNDGIASWVPPKDDTDFWALFPKGPPPTLFRHEYVYDSLNYPTMEDFLQAQERASNREEAKYH
jgi:hypothetical protein